MPNFKFDVDRVTAQLNRILQMELAGVIYYTHYSFMIYGHARIPITQWLREKYHIARARSGGWPNDHAATQKTRSRNRQTADHQT